MTVYTGRHLSAKIISSTAHGWSDIILQKTSCPQCIAYDKSDQKQAALVKLIPFEYSDVSKTEQGTATN